LTEKHDRPILPVVEIDHLTVPVTDYERSKRFYAEILRPLGVVILLDWHDERRAYLGVPPAASFLWLVESNITATLEIGLAAPSPEAVDAFHAAATAGGAQTVGTPGIRDERSSRYYAARVLDPDGNSIEAVHRTAATERRAAA
jgi:catechol 2,3-dioxygenase-like lactoylglutathione lyase family enzyme